jgi:uncharacterized protein (DUF2267 family)
MKLTGLDVFDSSIQRTNVWLKELMQELNWSDRRKTCLTFRCVLHTIRDHLPVNEAICFGEELPLLIRGLYFDRWDPAAKPLPLRSKNDFLAVLSSRLAGGGQSASNAEAVARAVFRLLDRKAADGEIEDLQRLMPPGALDLWPSALRAA